MSTRSLWKIRSTNSRWGLSLLGSLWERFVRPDPSLPLDVQRRLRFFNVLLVTEILAEALGTLLLIASPNSNRILFTCIIFLVGTLVGYVLSHLGQIIPAVWSNWLTGLLAVSYYVYSAPHDKVETAMLDFHSSAMLVVFPTIIAGIVLGPLSCVGQAVLTTIAEFFLVYLCVTNPVPGGQTDLFFVLTLLQSPVIFIALCVLLSVVFQKNIFGLFENLTYRNLRLQTLAGELDLKHMRSERLTTELKEVLSELRNAFGSQLANADQQQIDILDVSTALEELGRIAYRIDNLAKQASKVAADAVTVARDRADIINNNALIYGRLQQNMDAINQSVENLTMEAHQIDHLVSSISEVAEETNLLALNASIESAGRNEHRRRFSVVAIEVQRLAQRSREAAEEVRQVVAQIQTNMAQLADMSLGNREEAEKLSQSTHFSASTLKEIVGAIENSAQMSETIFTDVKAQQGAVISVIELIPNVNIKSEDMSRFTRRLLQGVADLEEALAELTQEYKKEPLQETDASTRAKRRSLFEEDEEDFIQERPFTWAQFRQMSWHRRMVRLTLPSHRLPFQERRHSRLLNLIAMIFIGVFFVSLPFIVISGFRPTNFFLPLVILLIFMIFVYSMNRSGYYQESLLLFYFSCFTAYLANYESFLPTDQLWLLDSIKSTSALLGLLMLTAAIIANVRWIGWLTAISIVEIIVLAFQRLDRSAGAIFVTLVGPIILLSLLGALAAYLAFSITRLTEQMAVQNRQLIVSNRALDRRERLESNLSEQIYALAADLAASFEHQTQLAISQLDLTREVTARISALDRGARQLVIATQQVVHTADNALRQAQIGAIGIESGLHSIEEFQERVAQIATSSADLQVQTGEIEQTFDLINDVSEEIDLLALNATVEASQAREAGKRFGAVASEIQHLSGRARQANNSVRQVINRIQAAVGQCVDLTEAGQLEIHFLSEAAYDTSRSVQEIVQTVNNTTNLVSQIQDAVRQQSEALTQTFTRLRGISAASETFRENITTSSMSVIRLNTSASELIQRLETNRQRLDTRD